MSLQLNAPHEPVYSCGFTELYKEARISPSSVFRPRPVRLETATQQRLPRETQPQPPYFYGAMGVIDNTAIKCFPFTNIRGKNPSLYNSMLFSDGHQTDYANESVQYHERNNIHQTVYPSYKTSLELQCQSRENTSMTSKTFEPLRNYHHVNTTYESSLFKDHAHQLPRPSIYKPQTRLGLYNSSYVMPKMSKEARKGFSYFQRLRQKALQQKKKHFLTPLSRIRQDRLRVKQSSLFTSLLEKRKYNTGKGIDHNTGKGIDHNTTDTANNYGMPYRTESDDGTKTGNISSGNLGHSCGLVRNVRRSEAEDDSYGEFTTSGYEMREKIDQETKLSSQVIDPFVHLSFRFHEQRRFHTDGKKAFRCPQCRYLTDRKNNLKRHIITMHQESSKLLECCGVGFQSKAALRDHNVIFHRGGYRCQVCARNFCRKALLRRHLTVHSGQKDYFCDLCGYATSHKSNLERHQKVHSKRSDFLIKKDKLRRAHVSPSDTDVHICDGRCLIFQEQGETNSSTEDSETDFHCDRDDETKSVEINQTSIFESTGLRRHKRKRHVGSKRLLLPRRLKDTYSCNKKDSTESSFSSQVSNLDTEIAQSDIAISRGVGIDKSFEKRTQNDMFPFVTDTREGEHSSLLDNTEGTTNVMGEINLSKCIEILEENTDDKSHTQNADQQRNDNTPIFLIETRDVEVYENSSTDGAIDTIADVFVFENNLRDATVDKIEGVGKTGNSLPEAAVDKIDDIGVSRNSLPKVAVDKIDGLGVSGNSLPEYTVDKVAGFGMPETKDNDDKITGDYTSEESITDDAVNKVVVVEVNNNQKSRTLKCRSIFSVPYSCPACANVFLRQIELSEHLCQKEFQDVKYLIPVVTSINKGHLKVNVQPH